ncbi:MAG: pectate lyase [Phycisphaerae bacterium]|nr:pectate lyase [Phycisphaerae bacterium]
MPKTWVALIVVLSVLTAHVRGAVGDGFVPWRECLRQRPQWYGGPEARRIADNLLLYQRVGGGWPKNTEMAAVLTDPQKAEIVADKNRIDSTMDNSATCPQMRYLARVHNATNDVGYRDAFMQGLDYLLAAQYGNGGWPQFYPLRSGYYSHITFNDGAMINVMTLLAEVRDGLPDFVFVDADRRAACARAVEKGVACILKCQIVVDGKRLAWCAQHDENTLKPTSARSYELATLSGAESVGVVRFLMAVEKPTPEIIAAINGAVQWFEQVKITGIREVRRPAPGTERGYDKVIVADPDAPPLWARFYEIGTNRPIFCSRDGIPRYDISEISYERRNGYAWYVNLPADLLAKDYPAWSRQLAE